MSSELEVPCSFVEALDFLIEQLDKIAAGLSEEEAQHLAQLKKFSCLLNKIDTKPIAKKNAAILSEPEQKLEKRTIYVFARVLSLGEIDTVNEKFKAEVHVKSCWREPQLDGTGCQQQRAYTNWVDYWKPELFIENGFPDAKESATYVLKYDSRGRALVEERRVLKGTFAEILELYDFPFDVQELTVRVGSTLSSDQLLVEVHPTIKSTLSVTGFRDWQQWQVSEQVSLTALNFPAPRMSVTCKVKRLAIFFWINVVMIMFVIGLLTFCTFTINAKRVESRLNTSFFLLLALVTYRFGVNKMLPKISYLTYLDKYMLANFSFICIVPIWHAIVAQVTDTLMVEYLAMTIIATLYLLFNIGFVIISKLTKKEKSTDCDSALIPLL